MANIDITDIVVNKAEHLTTAFIMFSDLSNLKTIEFNHSSGNITNTRGMLSGCGSLDTINFSNFNTSNITVASRMFEKCTSLSSFDLTILDMSSMTDVSAMFGSCTSLTTLDLSLCDMSKVVNISSLVSNCDKLTSLTLPLDLRRASLLSYMISGTMLTTLDFSNTITRSVTDIANMFRDCDALVSVDLSVIDTSKVTTTYYTFSGCTNLTDVSFQAMPLLTNAINMFYNCTSIPSIDISPLKSVNIESTQAMFSGCTSVTHIDLTNFGSPSATIVYMFYNCSSLLCLTNLDTSNSTTLGAPIFEGCDSLQQPDSSAQTDLTNGAVWVNANPCPEPITQPKFKSVTFATTQKDAVPNLYTDKDGDIPYNISPSDITDNGDGSWTVTIMNDEITGIDWDGNTTLTKVDIQKADDLEWMYRVCTGCISLVEFKSVYLPLMQELGDGWLNCSSLTSFDTSFLSPSNNVTIENVWQGCSSMTHFDISGIGDIIWGMSAFEDCSDLVCITPSMTTTPNGGQTDMFKNCTALKQPDAGAQATLISGGTWTNANPCPEPAPTCTAQDATNLTLKVTVAKATQADLFGHINYGVSDGTGVFTSEVYGTQQNLVGGQVAWCIFDSTESRFKIIDANGNDTIATANFWIDGVLVDPETPSVIWDDTSIGNTYCISTYVSGGG